MPTGMTEKLELNDADIAEPSRPRRKDYTAVEGGPGRAAAFPRYTAAARDEEEMQQLPTS